MKACVGPCPVDITAASALPVIALWKDDALRGFHIVRVCSRGKEETIICFQKNAFCFFSFLNTWTCKCAWSRRLQRFWGDALHAVSGCILSAGLSVFDLQHSNRFSSNTPFEKSIYDVNKNEYIIYSLYQQRAFPCCQYNPSKRQCGDWFHSGFIFGLATLIFNFRLIFLKLELFKQKALPCYHAGHMKDWLYLSIFGLLQQERQSSQSARLERGWYFRNRGK